MKTKLKRPSVFDYEHYRDFLVDFFDYKKQSGKSFSLRNVANRLDISAPHLKYVLDGKRQLSVTIAKRLTKILDLTKIEGIHFVLLVKSQKSLKMDYSETSDEFLMFCAQLIMPLTALDDFTPDPIWVSKQLNRLLSINEVEKALEFLFKNQMLLKNKNSWRIDHSHLSIVIDTSPSKRKKYINRLIDQCPECKFGVLTQRLTKEQLDYLVQEVMTLLYDRENLPYSKEKARQNKRLYAITWGMYEIV